MPLMIDAKIKPSGDFPAVDAADVLMKDGSRLSALPKLVPITQDDYDTLVNEGAVQDDVLYMIVRDEE